MSMLCKWINKTLAGNNAKTSKVKKCQAVKLKSQTFIKACEWMRLKYFGKKIITVCKISDMKIYNMNVFNFLTPVNGVKKLNLLWIQKTQSIIGIFLLLQTIWPRKNEYKRKEQP